MTTQQVSFEYVCYLLAFRLLGYRIGFMRPLSKSHGAARRIEGEEGSKKGITRVDI